MMRGVKYGAAVSALAVCWLFFLLAWPEAAKEGHSSSTTHHSPLTTHQVIWQGVTSCSATGCHHSGSPASERGNEFGVWFHQDAHSRAYDVLTEQAAKDINVRLRREAAPHRDDLCLRCHVDPSWREAATNPQFSLDDGVGCESCHGPAQKWLTRHYRKDLTDIQKRAGMGDTRNLSGRVRTCMACHVGAPGQDVNHDLIAAGHPALRFDFASYHAALPHHWNHRKDYDPSLDPRGRPDFEARASAAGKLAAGQAALRLLAARAADDTAPWPEFAAYDCSSCHHDLKAGFTRPPRSRAVPGLLRWDDWYFAGFQAAVKAGAKGDEKGIAASAEQFKEIGDLLETWPAPRRAVAERALRLARTLDAAAIR